MSSTDIRNIKVKDDLYTCQCGRFAQCQECKRDFCHQSNGTVYCWCQRIPNGICCDCNLDRYFKKICTICIMPDNVVDNDTF